MTMVSSRDFNQDTSAAKKQAANGPVIITDRGKPAHVLMTFDYFEKITGKRETLLDAIKDDNGGDFEFDIPKLGDFSLKVPDFD